MSIFKAVPATTSNPFAATGQTAPLFGQQSTTPATAPFGTASGFGVLSGTGNLGASALGQGVSFGNAAFVSQPGTGTTLASEQGILPAPQQSVLDSHILGHDQATTFISTLNAEKAAEYANVLNLIHSRSLGNALGSMTSSGRPQLAKPELRSAPEQPVTVSTRVLANSSINCNMNIRELVRQKNYLVNFLTAIQNMYTEGSAENAFRAVVYTRMCDADKVSHASAADQKTVQPFGARPAFGASLLQKAENPPSRSITGKLLSTVQPPGVDNDTWRLVVAQNPDVNKYVSEVIGSMARLRQVSTGQSSALSALLEKLKKVRADAETVAANQKAIDQCLVVISQTQEQIATALTNKLSDSHPPSYEFLVTLKNIHARITNPVGFSLQNVQKFLSTEDRDKEVSSSDDVLRFSSVAGAEHKGRSVRQQDLLCSLPSTAVSEILNHLNNQALTIRKIIDRLSQ